eukprot:Opistho-2@47774
MHTYASRPKPMRREQRRFAWSATSPFRAASSECSVSHCSVCAPPPIGDERSTASRLTKRTAWRGVSSRRPARSGATKVHARRFVAVSSSAKMRTIRDAFDGRVCRNSRHHCLAYTRNMRWCSFACERSQSARVSMSACGSVASIRGSSSSRTSTTPTGTSLSAPMPRNSAATVDAPPVRSARRQSITQCPNSETSPSPSDRTTASCMGSRSASSAVASTRRWPSCSCISNANPSANGGSHTHATARVRKRCPRKKRWAVSVAAEVEPSSLTCSKKALPVSSRTYRRRTGESAPSSAFESLMSRALSCTLRAACASAGRPPFAGLPCAIPLRASRCNDRTTSSTSPRCWSAATSSASDTSPVPPPQKVREKLLHAGKDVRGGKAVVDELPHLRKALRWQRGAWCTGHREQWRWVARTSTHVPLISLTMYVQVCASGFSSLHSTLRVVRAKVPYTRRERLLPALRGSCRSLVPMYSALI